MNDSKGRSISYSSDSGEIELCKRIIVMTNPCICSLKLNPNRSRHANLLIGNPILFLRHQSSQPSLSAKRIIKLSVIASSFLCSVFIFTIISFAQQFESPQKLLEKTVLAYSKLSSYHDTGIAERETGKHPSTITKRTRFSQWINRPNLERIEWTDILESGRIENGFLVSNENHISLYHSPGNAYTQRASKNDVERAGILGLAFGSTEPSTFTIRNLILGQTQHNQFNHLSNLKIEKSESIENHPCYVIAGSNSSKTLEFKFWIDTSDYLIRRIESLIKSTAKLREITAEELRKDGISLPDSVTDHSQDTVVFIKETHSNISINSDMPSSVFDFVPPDGAKFSNDLSLPGSKARLRGILSFVVTIFSENYGYIALAVLAILILLGYAIFVIKRGN
jgi:outer membrane lipoprotein-sorting protein